ncbi:MAG: alpha/beta hydrolase, partial [Oligoflexales bacterium]|nr:alpha/beta hydrolase [Oligoflexales bacterium]
MHHDLSCYLKKFLLAASICFFGGCNSMFYYPDKETYLKPSDLKTRVDNAVIKVADGEKLQAWILPPSQAAKGVVVQFHGNAQNMTAHVAFVHWLIKYGYYVVAFDYRGYGGSTGDPDRKG